MIVAINPGRSYSMETAQAGQPGNSQVPKRVHRWTLLLRSSMLIMILSVVTMDLLLSYSQAWLVLVNLLLLPWFITMWEGDTLVVASLLQNLSGLLLILMSQ